MLVDLIYDGEALVYPRKAFLDKNYWDNEMPEMFKTLKWKDILAKMADGVYEYYDFNNPLLPGYKFEDYYEGPHPWTPELTCTLPYGYGVCDNYQQVLERDEDIKKWVNDPDKRFVLMLCYVSKKSQPERGGWRWHKWGEYIGDQEPTCEYLYDEEDIEGVFTYKLWEIVEEPGDLDEIKDEQEKEKA